MTNHKKNIFNKKKSDIPKINMPRSLAELESIVYMYLKEQHEEAVETFTNYTEQRSKALEPVANLVEKLNASQELLVNKRKEIQKELTQIEENSIAKTLVLNKDTTGATALEEQLDAAILKKHKLKLLLDACKDDKATNITLEQRKELQDWIRTYNEVSVSSPNPRYRSEMANFLRDLSHSIERDSHYKEPESNYQESRPVAEKVLFQFGLLRHIAEPQIVTLVNKLQQRDKGLVRQLFDEWIMFPTSNFEERVIEAAAKHNIK